MNDQKPDLWADNAGDAAQSLSSVEKNKPRGEGERDAILNLRWTLFRHTGGANPSAVRLVLDSVCLKGVFKLVIAKGCIQVVCYTLAGYT